MLPNNFQSPGVKEVYKGSLNMDLPKSTTIKWLGSQLSSQKRPENPVLSGTLLIMTSSKIIDQQQQKLCFFMQISAK